MVRGQLLVAACGAMLVLVGTAVFGLAPAHATFPGRNGLIAFASLRQNGSSGIVSIGIDGRGRRMLSSGLDSFPTPSPDGRWIAFMRGGRIYVMRADGRGVRKVADGAEPTWSPDSRRIAFNAPGDSMLAIVNADGSHLRRLTEGRQPVWSPDGKHIAFLRFPFDLYVIAADGSGAIRIAGPVVPNGGNSPRPATWSPSGRRLAFVPSAGGPGDLFVANADGTGSRLVVDDPRGTTEPAWSPDGSRIAFVSVGRATVEVVTLATGRVVQLSGANAVDPAWSPDGSHLAFVLARQIYVVPAGGGHARQVTREDSTSQIGGCPAWTTAGRLVFVHEAGSDRELMTMNALGGRLRQLTHDFVNDREPSWSPDGSRLAFVRDLQVTPQAPLGNAEIYLMNPDGSGIRRLTRHAGEDQDPAWSRDGRMIAFSRRIAPDSVGLAVMDADGTHVRILLSDGFNTSPSWSPDGKQIVFQRWEPLPSRLYVVNADGTDLHPLLASEQNDETDPDWSPDGQRILFLRHNPCGGDCDVPSLVTIKPDGSDEQTILPYGGLEHPRWSPDGTMIVALGVYPKYNEETLTILRADGTPAQAIPPVQGEISDPAWQPLLRITQR